MSLEGQTKARNEKPKHFEVLILALIYSAKTNPKLLCIHEPDFTIGNWEMTSVELFNY